MFTVTPLLGAQSPSAASQSLLEFDGGVKVLVDVGWDESFDASKLQELEKHVNTLSIVLLTHPTIEHIGAFAHCCKHVPGFSRIPVYATTPVVNLGRTLLVDLYASSPLAASIIPQESILSSPLSSQTPNLLLQPPTPDEIASYFSLINPLKYSQPHQPIPSPFSPSLSGLTITAYSAGHTLGGTIWHIQHGLESIVYAADWNLAREKFLPGAAWLSSSSGILEPLRRPTALVCSSRGVEREERLTMDARNEVLISLIRETIAQGGKVLIPTDSSARVLELAFVLNNHWRANIDGPHSGTYKTAKIYMASKSSTATVRYLHSMLEWMDDQVTRGAEAAITKGEGQGGASNPLDWRYVRQIEKATQVERVLSKRKPCIMLASDASFEWGFSRQALMALAADTKNLVILTDETAHVDGQAPGVGRRLWDLYQTQTGQTSAQTGAKIVNASGVSVEMREAITAPLDADENGLYQQYLARQRQLHSTLQGDNTMNDGTGADVGDDQASESSESSEEDEDAEYQGRALNLSAQMTQGKRKAGVLTDAELGINVLLRGKNVHDYDVRSKRGREKMFPFLSHKNRDDEFGDVIKPEEYLRAEEKDDGEAMDAKPEQDGAAVGLKRKWDESTTAKKGGRVDRGQKKKAKAEPQKKDREPDAIDAIIAKATGEAAKSGVNGTIEEDSSESEESDYEPEDSSPSEQGPQKAIFTTQSLRLSLRIAHVDFSGLYRLNDMKSLIGNINPRKLIVTAGDEHETQTLAEACRQAEGGKAVQGEIFTPKTGGTVDASVDTNAWTVKLSRGLMKRLHWGKVPGGLDVVAVMGRLEAGASEEKEDESAAKKKVKLIKGEEVATKETIPAVPILDVLSTQNSAQQRTARPVHLGDLSLPQIREAVQRQGHNAEFRGGGTLLIDGTVLVRKSPVTGSIEVEAGNQGLSLPGWRTTDKNGRPDPSGTFYAVKKVIYDKLAVVIGA